MRLAYTLFDGTGNTIAIYDSKSKERLRHVRYVGFHRKHKGFEMELEFLPDKISRKIYLSQEMKQITDIDEILLEPIIVETPFINYPIIKKVAFYDMSLIFKDIMENNLQKHYTNNSIIDCGS